jgi:hypothetical protein
LLNQHRRTLALGHLLGHAELVAGYALRLRTAKPEPQLVIVSDADGALPPLLPATTTQDVTEFIS